MMTTTKTKVQNTNVLIGAISVFAICIICSCIYWFSLGGEKEKDYKTASYIICQVYVKNNLKSPATAKFPSSSSTDIRELEDNLFETRSYVDSQNSFGAMLRTNFYCKIKYIGPLDGDEYLNSNWQLIDLQFIQ